MDRHTGKKVWYWLKGYCNDLTDRLHSLLGPALLIVCFVFVVYVNSYGIVNCQQQPSQSIMTSDEHDYAFRLCQMSEKIYSLESVEGSDEPRRIGASLYQWVHLFLLMQAILFIMPSFFWRRISHRLESIVKRATDVSNYVHFRYGLTRQQEYNVLLFDIRSAAMTPLYLQRFRYGYLNGFGMHISVLYLATKCANLINVLGQLYLVRQIFRSNYHIEALKALIVGDEWPVSSVFPRAAFCDVAFYRNGAPQSFTLQCQLPMNIYNEMVFFVWFWMLAGLAVLTLVNVLEFKRFLICPNSREDVVVRLLNYNNVIGNNRAGVSRFANDCLCHDGTLLFMFLEQKAGKALAARMITGCWETFLATNRR